MCVGDGLRRRHLVLSLSPSTTGEQQFNLTGDDTQGLIALELWGYQFSGVPVVAGVPYSGAFYVGAQQSATASDLVVADQNSPIGTNLGVPCPLVAAWTSQQYDHARTIGRRRGQSGLPGSSAIKIVVRDDLGQSAQFTAGQIYCNLVYQTTDFPDMERSSTFLNRHALFAEHIIGRS